MGQKTRGIAILGSTGSIGTNTLDVVDRLGEEFRVTALAAGSNMSLLAAQVEKYRPALVSVGEKRDAAKLRRLLPRSRTKVLYGPEGAREVARADGAEIVVSAITGISGLGPTLEAVRAGRRLALANKESMVVAGALLRKEAARSGAEIIPVDSEHSGVFQCLNKERKRHVRKVILTASGGPFFRTPLKDMGNKTLDETLRHPRWVMGKKVTVDSATLMNKGLELIEARWLFDLEPGRLDVLIHPQSAVHSLVEMEDGSVLAQMSAADMRIPIQYALTWPGAAIRPSPDWTWRRSGASNSSSWTAVATRFSPSPAGRWPRGKACPSPSARPTRSPSGPSLKNGSSSRTSIPSSPGSWTRTAAARPVPSKRSTTSTEKPGAKPGAISPRGRHG